MRSRSSAMSSAWASALTCPVAGLTAVPTALIPSSFQLILLNRLLCYCSQAEVTMSGSRSALATGTGSTAGRGRGPTMSTEEATKPTSRAEAKAARREQLLNVAKTLYARHGFHGVRLD